MQISPHRWWSGWWWFDNKLLVVVINSNELVVITFPLAEIDGEGFFHVAWVILCGEHTAYINWLKSSATAEEALICIIFLRYPNIPNIHNHNRHYDHNPSVSLWLSWIRKIRECHLYFALPLPRGFDQRCFAGRDCKGVHGVGRTTVHLCPLAPLSSWCQKQLGIFIFCTNVVLQVCPRWRRPVFPFSRSPPAPWRDCLELDSL